MKKIFFVICLCLILGCAAKQSDVIDRQQNEKDKVTIDKNYVKNKVIFSKAGQTGIQMIGFPPVYYSLASEEEIFKYTNQKKSDIQDVMISLNAGLMKGESGALTLINMVVTVNYKAGILKVEDKFASDLKINERRINENFVMYNIFINPMYVYNNADSGVIFNCYTKDGGKIMFHIPEFYIEAVKEILNEKKVLNFFQ